jgi:hypothetical protein
MVSGTVQKLELRNFTVNSQTDASSTLDSNNQPTHSFQGRFPMSGALAGSCLSGGKMNEIRISGSEVRGKNSSAGLLFGRGDGCSVDLVDASSSSNSVSTQWALEKDPELGGLIGTVTQTTISRAVFGGTVGDPTFVPSSFGENLTLMGGILGYGFGGGTSLDQVAVISTARIRASTVKDNLGGLAGRIESPLFDYIVRNSFFAGELLIPHSVSSHTGRIGGIYAFCCGSPGNNVQVLNALNVGVMPQSTTLEVGPIEAAFSGPVNGTFYNSTTLSTFVDANEKGDGKTTAELQAIATYNAASWSIAETGAADVSDPGWALSSYNPATQVWSGTAKIWRITPGSYPSLVWRDFWPGLPSAPASVTSASPSAGTAQLTWSASSVQGFDPVTGYRIEQSTNAGSTWSTAVANTASTSTSATLSSLSPGSSYLFRVSGLSTAGNGPATATSSALLMGSTSGAPENLSAQRLSDNSYRVSWSPPSNTGGLAITGYTLQVDRGSGYETIAHTGTSADISGVSINSTWSFRVLATNSVGSSAYAVYTNTPPAPYSGPIITGFSNRNLEAQTPTTITLEGIRLNLVTELHITTNKLAFTKSPTDQLLVSLPALVPGTYDLRVIYLGGGVLTHQEAFLVKAVPPPITVSPPNQAAAKVLNFTNFAGDGYRLPAAASRSLTAAVRAETGVTKVVCTGSTSGRRATASDRRLATRRAQEACAVVKRLAPEVEIEIKSNPASGQGARFRSVKVELFS